MLTTAILLLALQAPAAAIQGRVVDADTGLPLARVLVVLEDTGTSVLTGDDGRFDLSAPPGRRTLFISVIGYALTRRTIDVGRMPLELTIPLSEGTGSFVEAVSVTSDRFAPVEPAVPAQHVLGSADIQNLRGVLADDPLRAVQVLPGVVSDDDLRSEFSVRGSAFSHINMTVEGFATPYVLHTVRGVEDYAASGSVSMINSDILQEVALLSGGYPQRFGNRTGAEVDFRLREGSRDRTHARLAVSGTNAATVVEGPLASKRGAWLVSARKSYLDLLIRQFDTGMQFGFSDTQAKLTYDVTGQQRLELALIAGRSRLEEQSEYRFDDVFTARNASAIAVAGWRMVKPRAQLTVRGLAARNSFSNTTTDALRFDEGQNLTSAVRADGAVAVRQWIRLEGGGDVERSSERRMRRRGVDGEYRLINDFSAHAVKAGAYAQAHLRASRLSLLPGVRSDRWSLTGESTVSPWLQAELALPRAFTMRSGTGVYQQFPGFEQVVGALAAPAPHAQRAVHLDVGLEHRTGSALRWRVTFYNRDESSFFRRQGAETRIVNDRVVVGSHSARFAQTLDGSARGIEVLLHRKSSSGISGWVSYSYGRHRYSDVLTGESFYGDLDQRHTFNVYTFVRKSDRLSFSAQARVGSNVPAPGYYEEWKGFVLPSPSRNDLRLPVYARVDLRANRTYNWSRSRMTLFAEIMNVLNRDNVRFVPPGIESSARRMSDMYERMIPIVPSVGVLIEF